MRNGLRILFLFIWGFEKVEKRKKQTLAAVKWKLLLQSVLFDRHENKAYSLVPALNGYGK